MIEGEGCSSSFLHPLPRRPRPSTDGMKNAATNLPPLPPLPNEIFCPPVRPRPQRCPREEGDIKSHPLLITFTNNDCGEEWTIE